MEDSNDEVNKVTTALGGLNITGSGNTVRIAINTSSSSSGNPLRAASKAATKAAPKRAAAGVGGAGERYYVITRCSRRPEVVGIWHASWERVCRELPGGQLFGSTARPCKGVDTLEEAIEIWSEARPEEAPVVRPP